MADLRQMTKNDAPQVDGHPAVPRPRAVAASEGAEPARRPWHVLLIEDSPGDARLIQEMLRESRLSWSLTHLERVGDAASLLASTEVDCILLDLSVLDADELEGLDALTDASPETPIIVLTHHDDELLAVGALQRGAQDYLPKRHLEGPLLTRAIRYAVERKQVELRLAHEAMHDSLTGLPNRNLFIDRLQVALTDFGRRSEPLAVLFIDLDHFKVVNDSLGHHAGDTLLIEVANRIGRVLRQNDTVSRFGGDEFTVLCPHLTRANEGVEIAQRIGQSLEAPISLDGRLTTVSMSIGIAVAETGDDPTKLISNADAALYQAKLNGRGRSETFTSSMRVAAVERFTIEGQLRLAIAEQQFELVYQPEFRMVDRSMVAAEALLRWRHPARGVLSPETFLAVAEETGLIVPIGRWVLETACLARQAWRDSDPGGLLGPIAVNVSPVQLRQPGLVETVRRTLETTGLPASLLQLEIVESALLDGSVIRPVLEQLRDLGAQLAIDDFGTGYSSLSYLQLFPAGVVKLDRSFVMGLDTDSASTAIARAVIEVAHAVGSTVVAEGVETEDELATLLELGCDLAQGFLLARPQSEQDVRCLLVAMADQIGSYRESQ